MGISQIHRVRVVLDKTEKDIELDEYAVRIIAKGGRVASSIIFLVALRLSRPVNRNSDEVVCLHERVEDMLQLLHAHGKISAPRKDLLSAYRLAKIEARDRIGWKRKTSGRRKGRI